MTRETKRPDNTHVHASRAEERMCEDEQEAIANADFTVQNEGTIYILYAQTDAARAWVDSHLPADRQTWGGNGTVVEHRYIRDILDGIRADGLEVH